MQLRDRLAPLDGIEPIGLSLFEQRVEGAQALDQARGGARGGGQLDGRVAHEG